MGKGTRQKFSVYRYGSFVFSVVNMDMWFVVLSYITEQHIDDHSTKTA